MHWFGLVGQRFWWVLVILAVVGCSATVTTLYAASPAAMMENRPAVENKPVVESKAVTPPEGKGVLAKAADMVSFNELMGDALWKVIGALVVFVALALLVIRLGRRISPSWRGGGPIFIEDGRNLAPGVGVRLLRVGSRYWLVGVTREQVTLIGELSEEDLLDEAVEEEEEPTVELMTSAGGRHGRTVRHQDEPSLTDRGSRR
ncbi:MAG: FliO/MopB family protein [Magnetococcales bacterium]|nr:FliO/MopB family protein [Magnetococcales bacterium]